MLYDPTLGHLLRPVLISLAAARAGLSGARQLIDAPRI